MLFCETRKAAQSLRAPATPPATDENLAFSCRVLRSHCIDAGRATAQYALDRGHSLFIVVGGEHEQARKSRRGLLGQARGLLIASLAFSHFPDGYLLSPIFCSCKTVCYHQSAG